MSKHVDLIAVGALLAFAFATRVHELASMEVARTRVFRAFPVRPIIVAPPQVPRARRLLHFPRV